MALPKGVVFYLGPSAIDGAPIVCVATLKTSNEKTGDMIQTWILRADQSPLAAINSGGDVSVCGTCPLRGIVADGRNTGRACYVTIRNAPQQVFAAWNRGAYIAYDPAQHRKLFRDRMLRLGAYGDPTAVPLRVWSPLLRIVKGWTGYTHQWSKCNQRWRKYLMASVESDAGASAARSKGWRTFRVRAEGNPLRADEIVCPASAEGGYTRTCQTCGACDGGSTGKRSVAINAHGSPVLMRIVGRYVS